MHVFSFDKWSCFLYPNSLSDLYIEFCSQNESSVRCLIQFLTLIRLNEIHTFPSPRWRKIQKKTSYYFSTPWYLEIYGKCLFPSASLTHKPEPAVQNGRGTWLAPKPPKQPGQVDLLHPKQGECWSASPSSRMTSGTHSMGGTNPTLAPLNPAALAMTRLRQTGWWHTFHRHWFWHFLYTRVVLFCSHFHSYHQSDPWSGVNDSLLAGPLEWTLLDADSELVFLLNISLNLY